MDAQKAIYDFIIVTIPGLLLYFIGWSYLYFYLNLFGVDLSELKLDLQTVFIYSYSPLHYVITYNWVVSTLIILVVFLLIFAKRSISIPLTERAQKIFRPISALPPIARTLALVFVLLFGIIFVLTFILVPMAKWTAERAANQRWVGDGPKIAVIINENGSTDKSSASSIWLDSFNECQRREELSSIFADENSFYLLCRSLDDPKHSGIVFEVRKEKETGLVSARYVWGGIDGNM